jgi:hypothetical protein
LEFFAPAQAAHMLSSGFLRESVALYTVFPQTHRHSHSGVVRLPRDPLFSDLLITVS